MLKEDIIGNIADIYEDYNVSEFGFCLETLCKKMEINLLPYSSYENNVILSKFDQDGFNLYNAKNGRFEIYYNDAIKPLQRIKFTIPHELGHICLGHALKTQNETHQQKREADLFANELYCPQAFIIYYKLFTTSDLIAAFGITEGYATILLEKLGKRKKITLSQNEKRLINIFERNRRK